MSLNMRVSVTSLEVKPYATGSFRTLTTHFIQHGTQTTNEQFSFVPELKGIMAKGLASADVGGKELENIIQDTKRFPKLLRRLKPQDVEEDRRLQGRTNMHF